MATRAWTPTSCGSCLATRRRRTAYHPTPPGCGALKQHSLSSSNNNYKSGNSRRVDALRVRSWVVASSSSSSGRSASIGNSAAVGVLGVVLLGGPWVPQAHAGFFGFGGESPPTEQVQPSDKPRTRSERIQYRMQRMKEEDARLQEIARKRQQMLREEPAYLAKAIAKSKALTRLEEEGVAREEAEKIAEEEGQKVLEDYLEQIRVFEIEQAQYEKDLAARREAAAARAAVKQNLEEQTREFDKQLCGDSDTCY